MAHEDQPQNIQNEAMNQGAQGIFYGPVTIMYGDPPATSHDPGAPPPSPERQQEVELFSKPPTGTTAREPRSIDWSDFFVWNSRPKRDDIWQTVVQPDLSLLRGELGRNRVQRVLLYPRLHSGLGVGVGYTFLRAMRITVEQPFPNTGVQMWASDAAASPAVQLHVDEDPGDPAADALSCEISISRDVRAGVDAWLHTPAAPRLRRRLRIAPANGPAADSVPDTAHATAFANQIGTLLRRKRDQAPGALIHLFAALPLGLEILIGLHLNACEPIQVYGYDNVQSCYYPFYRLG
jgi:hypothetical protein